MTPEQIEAKRSAIQAAIALVEGMSQHWMEERWKAANDLCDLTLQSLSQEAVRDEALEEAARVVWVDGEKPSETWTDSQTGKPTFDPIQVSRMNIAFAIRALKREPNAAGQAEVESEKSDVSAKPAPAAPDVSSMVRHLKEASHLVAGLGLPAISGTCDDAAALLAKLGQGWIPVKDKLPPEFPVLCLHENGAMYVGEWNGPPHYKTTHWMPLPPLPGASDD